MALVDRSIRKPYNADQQMLVKAINERLYKDYGRSLDGRQIWRIVWSSTELELKRGVHEEMSPSGNLFLREWIGVKSCLKYSYIMDKWVLERLTFGVDKVASLNVELVDAKNGSYEPAYVFMDKNGDALPVNWRFCELLFERLKKGPGYGSISDRSAALDSRDAQEILEMEEYFNEIGRSPMFASGIPALHQGTVPSRPRKAKVRFKHDR